MNTSRNRSLAIASKVFLFAAAGLGTGAGATVVVLDSFNDNLIDLSYAGDTSTRDSIVSPVATDRLVNGVGIDDWAAQSTSGALRYESTTPPGSANTRFSFDVTYRHESGSYSLLEYSALRLDVPDLIGTAAFTVLVDPNSFLEGTRVPITAPGVFDFPFSDLNDTSNLGAVERLTIKVWSTSTEFAITLDEVALVPEPSSLALCAAGFLAFSLRRSRRSEL